MANEFKIKKGLIVTGASGGTVVDIQGSQGQLFSVTDDLSGSIFAVSDISGVPILDVNSSGTVNVDGTLNVNNKVVIQTGATYAQSTDYLYIGGNDLGGGDAAIYLGNRGDGTGYGWRFYYAGLGSGNNNNLIIRSENLNSPVDAVTFNQDGFATFANKVRAVSWFQGASATDTLYSAGSTGVLLQTAGSTQNNNDSKIFFRNSGTTVKHTFDTYNGDATFVGQGFSSATSSGDASSTLTTKGYVDGLITGATIYRGAWQAGISATSSAATTASTTLTVTAAILDADGNTPVLVGAVVTGEGITGIVKVASVTSSTVYVLDTAIDATATAYIFSPIYGAPDLSGVTETSGYYYICSEAGSATPNGADSEPNTWNVGDWCIYNDVSGTGQWQKIDNSSVLSGAGTGQTVALWEGPSSVTDSETLGNAPITVSGNDTTFAGNVNVAGDITIDNSSGDPFLKLKTAAQEYVVRIDQSDTEKFQIRDTTNSATRLTIDSTGNVGIGTASPGAKLHVNSENSQGTLIIGRGGNNLAATNNVGSITFPADYDGTPTNYAQIKAYANALSAVRGSLDFNVKSTSGTLLTGMTVYGTSTGVNVGIGTTNPGAKLEITDGNLWLNGVTSNYNPEIFFIDDAGPTGIAGAKIRYENNNGNLYFDHKWDTATSGFFFRNRVDGTTLNTMSLVNGNVGIGTTSPQAPLSFASDVGQKIDFYHNTGNGDRYGIEVQSSELRIHSGGLGDATGGITFGKKTTSTFTEAMRITNGGNVGINETNPGVKLQLISADEQLTNFSSSVADQLAYSQINANSSTSGTITGAAALELVGKANASGHGRHAWIGAEGTPNTSFKTKLKFKIRGETASGYDWAGAAEAPTIMTLEGDGNVGIGTTSPRDTLEIVGNIRFVNGEDHLMIKPNNAIHGADFIVGDGVDATDTPVMSLNGLYGGQVTIQTQGNTIANKTVLDVQGTQGQLFSVTDDLSGDIFSVADISGVPIMNVNSDGTSYFDGNVGIGTDSPIGKLEVRSSVVRTSVNGGADELVLQNAGYSGMTILASNTTAAQIHFGDDAMSNTGMIQYWNNTNSMTFSTNGGSERMRIDSSGNVGIRTTTVQANTSLDVRGNGTAGDAAIKAYAYGEEGTSILGNGYATSGSGINYGVRGISTGPRSTVAGSVNVGGYFAASGAETNYALITGAGNVGIGTTSPGYPLTVNGTSAANRFYVPNVTATTAWAFQARNSANTADSGLYFENGDAQLLLRDDSNNLNVRINADTNSYINGGSLGLGTTSPNLKLDVISGTNNGIRISATDTTDNWRDLNIRSYVSQAEANALPSGSAIYTTNPSSQSEAAFSKYGGLVLQGRDNGNSSFAIRLGNGNGYATRMFMGATGVTTFSNTVTATNFILSSDERKKTKIKDLTCDNINVNWKSFELKEDEGEYRTGVIAQELEQSHPEFVKTDDEGFKSVKYIDLLIAKIAELEARLEKLEK
ncbi:tail fiber domain-containing protein [Pseudomonadales bacterium]|nr:tail fiber domain-containing protein [Pseudomonadales bacterium]